MYFLLSSLPLPYCPICVSSHPRPPQPSLTLFHTSHPLSLSLSYLAFCTSSSLSPSLPPSLHFLLSLTTLPFTVHPSPAPFSRTILNALPRSLSPPFSVAPGVPLVPVPVVDSTSARSRFANIARKRRRRRDYDRIRNHPPVGRVPPKFSSIFPSTKPCESRDNNKVSSIDEIINPRYYISSISRAYLATFAIHRVIYTRSV